MAILLASLFALGLVLFGARVHWVEEAGSAERDGYVEKAEQILRGEIPRDPYRPLLYPLLVAGATLLVGAPFVAARLLSNAAALLLVLLAYAFGVRLGTRRSAVWALLLTAANPNVWILGQHVATDMLFAAVAGVSLWLGLLYLEGAPRTVRAQTGRTAVAAGVGATLGLAIFTRTTGLLLAPGLLLAWWWSPLCRTRRHLTHLVIAASACLLVLFPHALLRRSSFGSPFYDENWKNLAWKLHGFPDWSYLERVPFSGLWDVVRSDPGAVAQSFLAEMWRFSINGSAQLLGTGLHVLLLLPPLWVLWRRLPRRVLWLLVSLGAMVAGTALTFFTWGRLLLVLLPPLNAVLAAGWCEIGDRARRGVAAQRRPGPGELVLLGLVALLVAKTFFFRLPAFVARHPYVEVATLRRLETEVGPEAVLAGTSPFLGRYLSRAYLYVPDAFGRELDAPELYYSRLRRLLAESGARVLVVGELDHRDRPAALLGEQAPMPWLQRGSCADRVCVWWIPRPVPPADRLPVHGASVRGGLGRPLAAAAPERGVR